MVGWRKDVETQIYVMEIITLCISRKIKSHDDDCISMSVTFLPSGVNKSSAGIEHSDSWLPKHEE